MSTTLNVCESQQLFNRAFRKAIEYNRKKDAENSWNMVLFFIWFIFALIGLYLAHKITPPGHNRVLHVILAVITSPLYAVAAAFDGSNENYIRSAPSTTAKSGFF